MVVHDQQSGLLMGRYTRFVALVSGLVLIAAACSPAKDAASSSTTATTSLPRSSTGLRTAPPPEPPPIAPLLRFTIGGDEAVFGQIVSLMSHVLAAAPISRLELWVDGVSEAAIDFAEPKTDPQFPWQWTADSVGLHSIVVKGFDSSGRHAGSSPVWLRVQPGWDPSTGRPLEGLPVTPLTHPSPGVTIDGASCTATVTVAPANGSLGQTVVGTTFGFGWTRPIAVVGPESSTLTVALAPAPVILTVEPYNELGKLPGRVLVVPGAPECESGRWVGDVSFVGDILEGPDELEFAYLYVTQDGSRWQRVPDTGFVPASSGGFDFSTLLPRVDPAHSMEVEAWGWADGQIVGLGRGRYEAAGVGPAEPTWGSVQPVTPYSSLNILQRLISPSSTDLEEFLLLEDVLCLGVVLHPRCGPRPATLRWNANLLGAEAGLIQVSSLPPPSGAALSYPGLLWTTMIAMDGQSIRDFEIPLGDILAGTNPSGGAGAGRRLTESGWFDHASLDAMGVELSVVAAPSLAGARPRTSQAAAGEWWQGLSPSRLWVRVVPFIDGKASDGVSNAVLFEVDGQEFTIEPSATFAFDALFDVDVQFVAPAAGNEKYAHCVRVVNNPYGTENPAPVQSLQFAYDAVRDSARTFTQTGSKAQGIVPGATVCAYKPDPPDKDIFDYIGDAISFIGQAWDTFKGLIDMVKNGIIKGIVDIAGCEPEATCVAALTALADAGLAAIGVPPTLPSFGQLAEAAKGDIAGALAKQLVGQACGAIPCEQFAEEFIEAALDDIEQHFSSLAVAQAQSGGWVLWLSPDIRVVPEPAGQLFPGSAQVRITRKIDTQDVGPLKEALCRVDLQTEGVATLSWTQKNGKKHTDEEVSGLVFAKQANVADLSQLGPGESVTVGVASIDFDRQTYLTGTGPGLSGYVSQEKLQSMALWTGFDARFKMFVDVCGKPFSKTFDKQVADSPGDIPTP